MRIFQSNIKCLIVVLITGTFSISGTFSQTSKVPRFSRSSIGDKGCYAYMPTSETVEFELSYSEDSSKIYTGEVLAVDSLHYGVILVELNSELAEENQEDMLISYLDYLKTSFDVTQSTGYGKGHTSERNPKAKGVIDYWEDADAVKYEVKGWVDSKYIAIMIIYGTQEVNYNVGQMFKDGIFLNE